MIVERVHKPTINLLHQAGILSAASAARAMLIAYYNLSSARRRPCTVSCSRIAKDLGVNAGAVRAALLRWKEATRIGINGQRRRSWKLSDSVTLCHAPQEQPEKRPALQDSVTECHVLALQNVTPERYKVSCATTEIELEKKDKEIARPALVFVDPRKKERESLERRINIARELAEAGNAEAVIELRKLEAKLANDERMDELDRRLRGKQ